jgi:hypothetical protein
VGNRHIQFLHSFINRFSSIAFANATQLGVAASSPALDAMVSARRAETRWLTRIIPIILAGCIGFATYVVVKHICGTACPTLISISYPD